MLGLLLTEVEILKSKVSNLKNINIQENIFEDKNFFISRKVLKKFLKDKIFYNDSEYFITIDGVIFNKENLINKYNCLDFENLIIKLYKEKETFFQEFKGTFSGVFYDKKNKKILVFTDQLGVKKIYYYLGNKLLVGSNLYEIIDILRLNKKTYTLDLFAAYSLLTHGSMLENITLVNEIKFLKAGEYIKYEENNLKVFRYHKFSKKEIVEKTEEEIIDKIDNLFNEAVKLQISKNKEYGYLNLAPLSAGLDSRMTNFILRKYIKDEIINITYSQNNYRDEKIPKKIASDLKNHWIFKSLDNGLSLKLLEEVSYITYGGVNSYGAAQVLDIIKLLDFDNIGLIHTGMFGEALAGAELDYQELGFSSEKLKNKLNKLKSKNKYEFFDSFEIYNYYNGSFLKSFMGSPKVFQEVSESFSPFYDIDFLQYTINISSELRKDYYIYDKWVLKKYPNATKYLHNGRKIGGKNIKILGRTIGLNQFILRVVKYILKKIKLLKDETSTKNHMNPLDYWYENNLELKDYFDSRYKDIIEKIDDSELKLDCKNLYEMGNTKEKDLVLTFLIAYRNIFLGVRNEKNRDNNISF